MGKAALAGRSIPKSSALATLTYLIEMASNIQVQRLTALGITMLLVADLARLASTTAEAR